MPNISRTVTCADVDANGCVTPPVQSPFNGDLYFTCSQSCQIKVCDPNLVVNGSVTVNSPCNVTFTGNLIINGTSTGDYTVLGTKEVNGPI